MLHRSFVPFIVVACLGTAAIAPATAQEAPSEAAPAEAAPAKADDPNQIPGWGKYVDPDEDCTHQLDDGQLTISVPGTAHDLSVEQKLMNAPMVIQEAQGNLSVQVKVSGEFQPGEALVPGRTPYQGAGLIMAIDNGNYIRLERAAYVRTNDNRTFHYANFEVRVNGQVLRIGQSTDYPLQAGDDVYLRIERQADQVRGSVSFDGLEWQYMGVKPFPAVPDVVVGVAAVNASTAPLETTFEALELNQDQAPQ